MTHAEIILAATYFIQAQDGRAWQTYPGKMWKGELNYCYTSELLGLVVTLHNAACIQEHAKDEPDLHAIRQLTITPDMVGKKFLQFGKVEAKTLAYPKVTKEQMERLRWVVSQGGFGYIVRETKDGVVYEEVKA